jgi:hypothetical protein
MKIYALDDMNLLASQAYRPQLERIFHNNNIYVIEAVGDYANLPAEILTLLNGRRITTPLKSVRYYSLYYKYIKADWFFHPESDFRLLRFSSNGQESVPGISESVGYPDRVYATTGVIRNVVFREDIELFSGLRSQVKSNDLFTLPLRYRTSYLMGVGFRLNSWDFASAPNDDASLVAITNIPDPEEVNVQLSGPFGVMIKGGGYDVYYRYDADAISKTAPPVHYLYTHPAVSDEWIYFTFKLIFDWLTGGRIEVYVNGNFVASYAGPLGYNNKSGNFVKLGYYHYLTNNPWPSAIASRSMDFKGLIILPESCGYTLADIYADLQAI